MSDMHLNNEKGCLFNEKITKSSVTFRKNKPNSPIVQTDVTSFITMNYAIFASLTKVKNKPNSNPIEANSNPIKVKTKPKQTQNKPNFENSNFQIRSLQNAKAANWNTLLSNGNTKKTSIIDN
jgi:poly-beta-hydroxyalkanoate depolymerase